MPEGALYFEQTYFPFTDENGPKTIPEAMQECMWHVVAGPPGPWVNNAQLREGAKRLRQKTDKAIVGGFGGNLLETGQFFYRNDNFFMLLAAEPAKAHKFLDDLVEIHLANLEKYPGGGRRLYRPHQVRRRPGNAERAASFAQDVPGVLQASPQTHVEPC